MFDTKRLEEKIQILKDKYTSNDDKYRISVIEKNLRKGLKKKKFADRSDVKEILKIAQKEVKEINFLLLQEENGLDEGERRSLFAERKAHEFWIHRLGAKNVDAMFDYLDTTVDMKLDEE